MSTLTRTGTFALSASASLVVATDAWSETFHSGYVAVVLLGLLLMHSVRFARIVFLREAVIYGCFVAYMLIQLLWTADRVMAVNTLFPAFNFFVVLVLYGSLLAMHELRPVVGGALAGFAAGAALYTALSGFPFRYPVEFSYNAVASMYVYGLAVALLYASIERRKAWLLAIAAIAWMHVVATTSIKANLGILLGFAAVAIAHFGTVWRLFWRHALAILVMLGALGFAIASSPAAMTTIERGTDRVALGLRVLEAREDLPGYGAFAKRANWQREGLSGWARNPVFGHGVEAFRSRFGITSHASHVDLLYNSGLIGTLLFYGVFVSVLLRLYRARNAGLRATRLVILGGVACYFFTSFAGTVHYLASLGAFLALSAGMLKRA